MTKALTRLGLAVLVIGLGGCDSNPFDQTQVPIVTVSGGDAPVISWTPEGALLVRVYRGAEAGDGYTPDLIWDVSANDGRNGLQSPLAYGGVPTGGEETREAGALVAGEPYTVWVLRYDEAGSGDGFTNTRRNYTGTATFIAE